MIAHGMLMMAYLGRMLTDLVTAGEDTLLQSSIRRHDPVRAEPECTARVVALNDGLATLELAITLADGTVVVRGEAVVDIR